QLGITGRKNTNIKDAKSIGHSPLVGQASRLSISGCKMQVLK
ncbi:unnamed protein product, partial [marine sediment metagenome]